MKKASIIQSLLITTNPFEYLFGSFSKLETSFGGALGSG